MRWVSDFNPNPMERSWVHLRRSRIGLLLGSYWIAGRVGKRFRFKGPPSTSYFNGFTPSHLGPRYYSCHIYMNQRVRFLGYLRCLKGRFSKWTRAEMSEHVPRHGFHPRVCCIWGNYNHFQTSSTTKWWRHSCNPSKLRNGLRMVRDFVRFTHIIQVNLQTVKNCTINSFLAHVLREERLHPNQQCQYMWFAPLFSSAVFWTFHGHLFRRWNPTDVQMFRLAQPPTRKSDDKL